MIMTRTYGHSDTTKIRKTMGVVQEIKDDIAAGKDFIISDFHDHWCGKPCNLEDLQKSGYGFMRVRYRSSTRVSIIDLSDLEEK
jgi:hypothetical protein